MTHWFYITPEEFERAAEYGVDKDNLERRVRLLSWDKELAITTPLRPITDRSQWSEIAKQNGIKYQTFMNRVGNLGWGEERAATTQPISRSRQAQALNKKRAKNRVIPTDMVKLAESNGIQYATLHRRIFKQGLTPQEAATQPLKSRKEVQQMGKEAYERIHGRFNAKVFKVGL